MPFLPAEAKALIVEDSDDLCHAIIKVVKSFRLAYRYVRYRYKDDGTLSDKFCSEIKACAANTTTTGSTTP